MCQEEIAEQIVDFPFPAIGEELVEVILPLPQDCVQGQLAEASVSGAHHPQANRGADGGTLRATDQGSA